METNILNNIRSLHFIGVGGVSMSKLAVFYSALGFEVSGSDASDSETLKRLRDKGLNVYSGSNGSIAGAADAVVYSSAISVSDPEYQASKIKIERKELLSDFASRFNTVVTVSGAHGKTTASAVISHILECAGRRVQPHIGGDRVGADSLTADINADILVAEGCEYKRSFLKIPTDYAIALNVDFDHPDTYKDVDEVYEAFAEFLHNSKRMQLIEYDCFDRLEQVHFGLFRDNFSNAVTFGENAKADYSYSNVSESNGFVCFDVFKRGEFFKSFRIPSINRVIAKSAIAAIALSDVLSVDANTIFKALESFGGVARRAECMGLSAGGCRVITDYAHHPQEIKSLIINVRNSIKGKIIAVFEPHTYSRTKALIDDFVSALSFADERIILPTYPAREKPEDGVDSIRLTYKFREDGIFANYSEYENLPDMLKGAAPDDVILLIGAGIRYKEIYAMIR